MDWGRFPCGITPCHDAFLMSAGWGEKLQCQKTQILLWEQQSSTMPGILAGKPHPGHRAVLLLLSCSFPSCSTAPEAAEFSLSHWGLGKLGWGSGRCQSPPGTLQGWIYVQIVMGPGRKSSPEKVKPAGLP